MPDLVKKKGKLSKWVKAYAIGGQGLDEGTTLYGLNNGAKETNPFLPKQPWANAAVKSGSIASGLFGLSKLAENHPKLANTLGIAMGSAGLIPGLINYNRLRSIK